MDSEKEIVNSEAEAPAREHPTEPVLFENVHVRNEVTYKELYRHLLFGGTLNAVGIGLIVAATVLICIAIGGMIAKETPVPLLYWCAAAFGVIYVPLFKVFPYRYYVKYAVARDAQVLEGAEARLVLSVTERAILIDAPQGEHVELKYSTFKSITPTKHYLLITTYDKVIYTVARDGFTKGSYEDFCAFLRGKGFKF